MLFLASGREALKMARERRLPSVRVGRRVLFLRDEVLRFLAEQSRDAVSDDDLRRGRV
jgi:excisionase family DNA binding protein